VCPVKINIPEVLVHMRGRVVRHYQATKGVGSYEYMESMAMKLVGHIFADQQRYEQAQKLARIGQWPLVRNDTISYLPGMLGGWTAMRDLKPVPRQSFRDWWKERV
jgi:L-lactate dehydrogenase complex protein LldF